MRVRMVSGRSCVVLLAGLTCSCARVDHTAEFRQAAGQMKTASGLETPWGDGAEPQDLTLDDGGVLPLDRAVALALRNNRSLRADMETIASAKADLVQAGLLSNPMLTVMARFPEGGGRASLDFGLSKDIADLWLIPSRKRAAQRMLQRTILSFTDSAVALINEVKTTYYTVGYQTTAIELQNRNIRVLRETVELAQARFRAGDTSQLDVNLTRSRLIEAQLELLALQTEYGTSQRTLLRMMGVAAFPGEWRFQPIELPRLTAAEDESVVENTALERRLDVQAAWWEVEAAAAEVEQQRLRLFPSLGLGLSATRVERRATPGRKLLADTARASAANGALTAPDIQSRAERRRERSQEIDAVLGPSIEVPLPIFDQNQAQVAKAQARARELKQRYEEIQQRVVEGVRTALYTYRLAQERVRVFKESLLPQQEANLRFAEKSYQAGQETILTVLLAQEALIRSQLSAAAAERDLAVSSANLERQLAGQIPDFLLQPTETASPSAPPEGGEKKNDN